MTFGDFNFDDEELEGFYKYHNIYERIKEALTDAKIIYFDSEELLDTIEYFLDEEENEIANIIIDYALKIYQDNNDFLLLKSEVFIEFGEYNKAFKLIDEVNNKEPYLPKIYILRAAAYENMGKDEEALNEYIKALNNNVNDIELIYEELGYYYLSKKKYIEAAENFKLYIDIDSENSSVFDALTNIFLESLGTLEGLSVFKEYTGKYPDAIYAWYSTARLFEAEEMYEKAIAAYEKVLRIDDTFINAILNAISCLRKIKNYKRIFKICKHYKDFNYPLFHFEMADTYLEMGEVDAALSIYESVLEKNSKEIPAIIGKSRCYMILEDNEKAYNVIESALFDNKDNIELMLEKAFILKIQEKYREAIDTYKYIAEINVFAENNGILSEIADLYIYLNEIENAIKELEDSLEIYPEDAKLMYMLAACYYNRSDNEKAYYLFEDALVLEPDGYDAFFERTEKAQYDSLFLDLIKKHDI